MKNILITLVFLTLPISAYADWSAPGMAPNFTPNQGQPLQRQVHTNVAPSVRAAPQHRVEAPRPVVHNTAPIVNRTQKARHDQPVTHRQDERRKPAVPVYFRHDVRYYGYDNNNFVYADVDAPAVPDGLEAVAVDGQTYFYADGVFYQQIDNQLVAIPPVLGAIVDSIPEDYQIVMADGVHYLFTGGVYYQRVDQGFQVVQFPASDQE